MSTTIDQRVVEMKFDNASFEKNVATSMSTLEKLKKSLNLEGASKGLEGVSEAAKNCDMSGLSSAVETVKVKFSAFEVIALTALVNITNSAISAGEQLIKSLSVDNIAAGWDKFGQKTQAVGTLISQGYDLEKVTDQLERLNWYTDETSYNFTDMVANIAKFTASGQDLETSVTAMEGIANWAALSGQNATTASQAMYQLAQAMSAGYMRLEDYKSIQNASMDTAEFRQKCLDAAVALGTLKENADGTYSSLVDGADSTAFSLSSFTTNLTKGCWLTSDVMMEVFNTYSGAVDQIYEYAEEKGITASEAIAELGDSVDEFGLKAFKAAQEARTWSDVIDSVKDAVSTGWMNTFELIFGNYEEATELWTDLANAMYDVFAEGGNVRNEILQEWKDLGGRDDLIESFWNAWEGVSSIITPIKEAFRDIFPQTTADQLYNITKNLKEFTAGMKLSDTQSENLKSTFKGLFAILDIVKQAFSAVLSIFSPLLGAFGSGANSVLSFTGSIGDFLVGLDESIKSMGTFTNTAGKLRDVVQILADFLGSFVDNTIVSFYEGGMGLSGVLEVLFDTFNNLVRVILDSISALTGFDLSGVRDKIVDVVQSIRDKIVDFVSSVQEKFSFSGFELFHEFLEKIKERMGQVNEATGGLKEGIVNAFTAMGNALEKCQFIKLLQGIWNVITVVGKGIVNVLGGLIDGLIEKLNSGDFKGIFDLLNSIIAGGIGVGIFQFVTNLKDTFEDVGGIFENVKGILEEVKDTFKAYQTELKAKTLLTIAAAIGILAVALIAISAIPSETLNESLGALTVMFVDLIASMAVFSKVAGNSSSMTKAGVAMIAVALAVKTLASALVKIGELDWNQLAVGLTGITVLLGEVVIVTKLLSNSGSVVKGTANLILLAEAINILASVCIKISSLDWDELARGLTGVGVLLAELAAFMAVAKFGSMGVTTGLGLIELGAAILILANSVKTFGEMDTSKLIQGLIALGVVLGELEVFIAVSKGATKMVAVATAMVIMGAALEIMCDVVSKLGGMDIPNLVQGLIAMAAVLVELEAFVLIADGSTKMLSTAAAMVVMGAALEIIVNVIKKFGAMSLEEIAKGIVTMGLALAEMAIGLKVMSGSLSGSAALLVAASALLVLTPVLVILGSLSWESIIKGLVSLAGVFTVLGVAGVVLTGVVPTILALSAAIAVLGVGLLAAGVGITAISIAFTALGTSLSVVAVEVVAAIAVILNGLLGLIPTLVDGIADLIVAVCEAITRAIPAIGEALKAIILTAVDTLVECVPEIVDGLLVILTAAITSLATYAPTIVDQLMKFLIGVIEGIANNIPELIAAAIDLVMAFFSGIVDALSGIDTDTLLKGIVGIGLLSALMVALSAVGSLAPAAMVGVLAMGVVIAELALVLAAIGALAQIPGLEWLINEGGQFLESVGNAIGSFVGGIVGGFLTGVSSQFPQIGSDLSAFMTNIQPFIEGASQIDASMMDGVNALAKTILILTAADILDSLTSWLTGGSSLSDFASELVPFGEAMRDFSLVIAGMDGELVANAATAGLALAEMASTIPNSGGVVGFFAGENDMSAFGEQLIPFGEAMMGFAEAVAGLDADAVTQASIAGKAMAEMATTIPNTGGVVGFFTGENDMDTFGEQLVPFGEAMKNFSDAVKGLDANVIVESATAGAALVELANTVPNTGGVVGFFTGENDMDDFGAQLVPFGEAMKTYADAVSGIDADAVVNSATAGKAVVELANTLPNTGGLVSWFTGDNDIAAFGESLISFGENFSMYSDYMKNVDSGIVTATANAAASIVELQKSLPESGGWFSNDMTLEDFGKDTSAFAKKFSEFYNYISGIDTSHLSRVITQVNKLVDMANGMAGMNTSGMSGFSSALKTLGQAGIDEFINVFNNSSSRVSTAASNMLTTFINAANAKKSTLSVTFTTLIQAVLTAINNKQSMFTTAGTTLMIKFIAGVKAKDSAVKEAFTNSLSGAVSGIKDYYSKFYDAGAYLVDGFCKGITDNTYKAEARAKAMAKAAAEAAAKELDEHSPSRVGYQIGDYFGVAFVNAIGSYEDKSYDAGSSIADAAKSGLTNAVAKVYDLIENGVDSEPTIRPVLDLSNVESGAARLNAMFSRTQAMSIGASMNEQAAARIQNGENTSTNGNTFNLTQNNYSPKALSRVEIYRQTKNQFSALERMVEA